MSLLATSANRVKKNTAASVNRRIAFETYARLERIGHQRQAIELRLDELDQEWDIERMLEANASSVMLVGTVLGLTVDKRFFVVPLAVSSFLLQHALQGWCPPLPVLRRFGFRTAREIEDERHELLGRLKK
jgi:hypothetical protein